jgi:hypothetical protein
MPHRVATDFEGMLGNHMSTTISPLAGKPEPASSLVDASKRLNAYASLRSDAALAAQRFVFGKAIVDHAPAQP